MKFSSLFWFVNLLFMDILYKCYPNKTVFFIVCIVTVLLQGQFKVETTTSFQPQFNVVSTLKLQAYFNLVSSTFLAFDFCRFWVVIRGFSSPSQRPMTSDFEGFSIPDFILYIYLILILEKEPVFPFWMFCAKQGHYWYHFYNVFGMTRSSTGDWTRDLPHSKPALYH